MKKLTEITPEQITDEFITNLHKGNYLINPNANWEASYPELGKAKKELEFSLEKFCDLRYDPSKTAEIRVAAITCVSKINNAWLRNLVKENPSVKTQLKQAEQENSELREQNDTLAKENDHLKKQITELHETIDRITAKGLSKSSDR